MFLLTCRNLYRRDKKKSWSELVSCDKSFCHFSIWILSFFVSSLCEPSRTWVCQKHFASFGFAVEFTRHHCALRQRFCHNSGVGDTTVQTHHRTVVQNDVSCHFWCARKLFDLAHNSSHTTTGCRISTPRPHRSGHPHVNSTSPTPRTPRSSWGSNFCLACREPEDFFHFFTRYISILL